MKLKKITVLLLVTILLAAALSACGSNEKKETQGKEADSAHSGTDTKGISKTGAGQETGTNGWSWPLEEQKELSIWKLWSSNYLESVGEIKGVQKIEEETNVKVNWVTVSIQEAQEKFGLMMASGDYPDIVSSAETYYTGGVVQGMDDGVFVDVTEYIPKYMPNYQALRTSSEKLQKDTSTDDGRILIYTLASKNGEIMGERIWGGPVVRRDWLDELGLAIPETIDEWETVLRAFKENYHCEAPLLLSSATAYDYFHNFVSAYGVLGEFYQDNGNVKYGPLEEGYRQWVELFRKWYEEGLVDQNFVSNDAFAVTGEYVSAGKAGASSYMWGMTGDYYKVNGYTDEEDFYLAAAPTPVLKKGDTPQIGTPTSELTKEVLAVTNNCKDIELACRWLDYWYEEDTMLTGSLGIEGESYIDNGDGTYVLADHIQELVDDGSYPSLSDAFSTYSLGSAGFGLYNWYAANIASAQDEAAKAYDVWDSARFDRMLPSNRNMTEEETVAFNNKYTAIRTLVQENTLKFITGQKPMEEYDSFVRQLYEYGIEECISCQQAALDRYNAR